MARRATWEMGMSSRPAIARKAAYARPSRLTVRRSVLVRPRGLGINVCLMQHKTAVKGVKSRRRVRVVVRGEGRRFTGRYGWKRAGQSHAN